MLKRFSDIQKFLFLNNIKEKYLLKAASHFKVRFVKKDKYFIHEGEPSRFFAGVIKGKVSVRKTNIYNKETKQIEIKPLFKAVLLKKPPSSKKSKDNIQPQNNENDVIDNEDEPKKEVKKNSRKNIDNNLSNTNELNIKIVKESYDLNKYELIEEELFRKGEGYCFGEWALIYNQPRSASVYTLEDCVFFTLDEIYFKKSFLNSLEISEFNKKNFALRNFFSFHMVNEKLSSLYKNCIPISCKKNQIIFNEGEKSDSIYLVYLGSFTLKKKFGYKLFNILNLEKGSIVGLESVFGDSKSKYKCSLRLSSGSNFGLIFQLKINKLKPHLVQQMKIGFKEHYDLFMNSWKELFKTNTFVREFLLNKLQEENIKEGNKELLLDYINDYEIYDSLLKFQKVDKYEALFKKCNKSNDYEYENRKKDGSLRIFSSKQKNRVYDEEDEKNKIQHNINIIKYFKQSPKKNINYDRTNLKSASPLRIRKLTSLNNNEPLNRNTKIKKESLYDLFSTSENNNEINNGYSKTENLIKVNFKEKSIKINDEIIPKQLKFKVRNNDTHGLKQNNRYDQIKSQKEIIEFFDNNKQNQNKNRISINKIDFVKEKIKNFINYRKEIGIKSNKNMKGSKISIIKKNLSNKSIIKRNDSLRILNNINPLSKTNKENKNKNKKISFINNFESSSTRNSNKKLFRANILSARNNKVRNKVYFQDNNNISKIKLKKSASLKQFKYLTPKEDKIIQYLDKVRNKSTNKSVEHSKDKYIINNKIKELSTKYADIYKECNLNNGFSVSYFKKINEINKFEIIEYTNSKYPLSPNKFKIAFNSGDFNIPLVSSSISFKRSYRK